MNDASEIQGLSESDQAILQNAYQIAEYDVRDAIARRSELGHPLRDYDWVDFFFSGQGINKVIDDFGTSESSKQNIRRELAGTQQELQKAALDYLANHPITRDRYDFFSRIAKSNYYDLYEERVLMVWGFFGDSNIESLLQ